LGIVGQIYVEEGIRGFWRGNFANLIRIVPHKGDLNAAAKMKAFGWRCVWETKMAKREGGRPYVLHQNLMFDFLCHEGVLFMCNDTYRKGISTLSGEPLTTLPTGWSFLSGSLAGMTATVSLSLPFPFPSQPHAIFFQIRFLLFSMWNPIVLFDDTENCLRWQRIHWMSSERDCRE
jgi:hypothetical protein